MQTNKQTSEQRQSKKEWRTPHLTVHGTVEEVTRDKVPGESDAYTAGSPALWTMGFGDEWS